jgi:hypothetical protein
MLNNVPTQINRSARLVTLRHPNAMDCTVFRKQINRTAATSMGGMPTIGGLGVIDSEDEADYTYVELGDAKIVFTGQFQTQGNNFVEDESGLNYAESPIEALVECVLDPAAQGYFVLTSKDMVMVEPGGGFALAYEVAGETGSVNIPPYTKKFLLSPRQDANVGI